MTHELSPFHNHISHAAHVLYVDHYEEAQEFYKKLGFINMFRDDLLCVMRLKLICVELWNNQLCKLEVHIPDQTRKRFHHALLINVRNIPALHDLHTRIASTGIETNSKEIDNDSSPFGENFTVEDPDKNKIIFRTSRMLSNPVSMEEHYCELLMNHPKIFERDTARTFDSLFDEDGELDLGDWDDNELDTD